MSDPTSLTIIGFVGALVLSVIWILWRRSRAPQNTYATTPPLKTVEAESTTASTPPEEPVAAANGITIGAALLALGLAGLGQYGLITQRIGLAWLGYGIGSLLFVSSVWRLAPYTYEPPAPHTGDTERPDTNRKPWSFGVAWPTTLASPRVEGPKPVKSMRVAETPSKPTVQGTGFVNNWRYYTVADILHRRQPKLPPAPPQAPVVVETEVPPVTEEAIFATAEITPAASEIRAPSKQTVLTGFERPESLALANDGRVFVWDAGQRIIHELDPEGRLINKWPVELEDSGPTQRLAISPDGRTAYLADTEHGRIYRIVLGA